MNVSGSVADERLVVDQPVDARVLRQVHGVGEGDVVRQGTGLCGEELCQAHERVVEEQGDVLGVIDDVAQLLEREARVDGVEHRAKAGHREVDLEVPLRVPGDGGDAVAPLDAHGLQGVGELADTPGHVAPRGVMRRPLDGARHHLRGRMESRRELDLLRDEQRQVHHLPDHRKPSTTNSNGFNDPQKTQKTQNTPKHRQSQETRNPFDTQLLVTAVRDLLRTPAAVVRSRQPKNPNSSRKAGFPTMAMVKTFWLSMHVPYACRHSGVCCSSGWAIAVEHTRTAAIGMLRGDGSWLLPAPGAPPEVAGILALANGGHCVFHRQGCEIQRAYGHAALPSACQHFPREVLIDARGVSVTLSHYCPTAVDLLFDHVGSVEIVEGPPALPTGAAEGLDARDVLPPLLTEGVLMDMEGCSAWEAHMVRVLTAHDAATAEDKLARLEIDLATVQRWRPGLVP